MAHQRPGDAQDAANISGARVRHFPVNLRNVLRDTAIDFSLKIFLDFGPPRRPLFGPGNFPAVLHEGS